MAVVNTIRFTSPLPGGHKLITGELNLNTSSYASGGIALELANIFSSKRETIITIGSANGLTCEPTTSNVSSCNVRVSYCNSSAAGVVTAEVPASTNLTGMASIHFTAIGPAK